MQDASFGSPRVCLISMPFMPVNTPGIGVSTLKASLQKHGLACDIFYGSLEFIRFVMREQLPELALFDYNFISTNHDMGDVMFSGALWDRPEAVRDELLRMFETGTPLLKTPDFRDVIVRAWSYLQQVPAFVQHCATLRDWSQYDVVGFSSTFCQNASALSFARLLKTLYPSIHIVFGGANCDGEMGAQLIESFPWVDAVIQGEADETLPRYVTDRRAGRDTCQVPGALVRMGDTIRAGPAPVPVFDMDGLPFPDYSDYYAQIPDCMLVEANREQLSLILETSRGCWWGQAHHCSFCGLNPTTMKYRSKSPQRVLQEIRCARDTYKERRFTAVDNILDLRYFRELFPLLEHENVEIFYETKSNLSESQVEQMGRSGVGKIQPGIESLSTELLREMKKGVQGYQNLELLKWCATYNVEPIWFCLYRFPNENPQVYWEQIDRIGRLTHLPPPKNPNPVVIDRYSPLYRDAEQNGLGNLRPNGSVDLIYYGLTREERMRISYHFKADLPLNSGCEYEVPLWRAVVDWNTAYATGARLYQFHAGDATLVIDTRRAQLQSYLLRDTGHALYKAMRTAQRAAALDRVLTQQPGENAGSQEWGGLLLAHCAGMLNARVIPSPSSQTELPAFLEILRESALAEWIDERWLALAVDCRDAGWAGQFGLEFLVSHGPREAIEALRPASESLAGIP